MNIITVSRTYNNVTLKGYVNDNKSEIAHNIKIDMSNDIDSILDNIQNNCIKLKQLIVKIIFKKYVTLQ